MRKLYGAAIVVAAIGLAGSVDAQQNQVDGVNIVYPINGSTVPVIDPAAGSLSSAMVGVSFSVSCRHFGGIARWSFNGSQIGSAEFVNRVSVQFDQKLPGGKNKFTVTSSCGQNKTGSVVFAVGQ